MSTKPSTVSGCHAQFCADAAVADAGESVCKPEEDQFGVNLLPYTVNAK